TPQTLLQSYLTFGALSFILEGVNKQQPAALAHSFSVRNKNETRPLALPISLPLPDERKGPFSSFCKSLSFILRVDIQTPGWENTMIKVLKGIPGATFSIDPNGITRVSGKVDPGKTLKLLAKAGKHAQLYCIDSRDGNQVSERRNYGHQFLDDHHGRYWQANHQYYHHPYDPIPRPPQYLPQPPMLPPPLHYFDKYCNILLNPTFSDTPQPASWFSPKCVGVQQLTGHLGVKHCFGVGSESGTRSRQTLNTRYDLKITGVEVDDLPVKITPLPRHHFIDMFSSSEQYLSFGLRVHPQSPGWYESLTKILKTIKGATYTIDAEQGMAFVSGRANSKSILKKLRKSGLEVAWIKTGKPTIYSSHGHGYYQTNPYLQYPYQYCHPYGYYSTRYY
ncbi:hypothetical protein Golax_022768, partial [Gossypium laxum]|nr:hypothetical protein [Gossypium laxum]